MKINLLPTDTPHKKCRQTFLRLIGNVDNWEVECSQNKTKNTNRDESKNVDLLSFSLSLF